MDANEYEPEVNQKINGVHIDETISGMIPITDDHFLGMAVAIAIPEPFGSQLTKARLAFGDHLGNYIAAHITLLPPTRLPLEQLSEVRSHLTKVAALTKPFTVKLDGTATFRPISPVVFVQLAQGFSHCQELERKVRSGVLYRDLEFAYHPHVTVAHLMPDEHLDRAMAELADFEAEFEVTEFILYDHGPDGVSQPLHKFKLQP